VPLCQGESRRVRRLPVPGETGAHSFTFVGDRRDRDRDTDKAGTEPIIRVDELKAV